MSSLILHISDLHLADEAVEIGDYAKGARVPHSSRQTRGRVLSESMIELRHALVASSRRIDSVVVSGDITSQARADGFSRLGELLGLLGDRLPPAERVLVVPGNHDVDWNAAPSTQARYEGFLELRTQGYRTPLLEGVDFTAARGRTLHDPLVVGSNASYVLIALNSANYCGVRNDVGATILKQQRSPLRALTQRRDRQLLGYTKFDMARIDPEQLRYLDGILKRSAVPADALRILVLHHQVVPVTDIEELKPFESIINLGQLNDWMVSNRIDIVLHGHKHVSRTVVGPVAAVQGAPDTRIIAVVSAPSVQPEQTEVFARLLEINDTPPRPLVVPIRDVPVRLSPSAYAIDDLEKKELNLNDMKSTFTGMTITAVHDQLLANRDRFEQIEAPLVCRVQDGPSCIRLPDHYPDIELGTPDLLDTALDWWQRPVRGKAAAFNHGERLFGGDSTRRSQIQRIVELLSSAGGVSTSKALAIVVDPSRDYERAEYPSFVTVQFILDGARLNLIATFRKQEMPHWWPINMAELSALQSRVIDELANIGTQLEAGSITTVTAIPRNGEGLPRVAVPWLDRQLDNPDQLVRLVAPLMTTATAEARTDCRALWDTAFDDWMPAERSPADRDPVPVEGLETLAKMLEVIAAMPVKADLLSLANRVRDIAATNRVYANAQGDNDRLIRRSEWVKRVAQLRVDLDDLLEALLPSGG